MSSFARRAVAGAIAFAALSAAVEGQSAADFTITNSSGFTIVSINVSPQDSNQWGPDILGSEVLVSTESASVAFDRDEAQCNFDIRATFEDNTQSEIRGADLCQASTVEFTPAN